MSHFLQKPIESLCGYLTVLPGAFSAFRWAAVEVRRRQRGGGGAAANSGAAACPGTLHMEAWTRTHAGPPGLCCLAPC